jgi:hypothetical protein
VLGWQRVLTEVPGGEEIGLACEIIRRPRNDHLTVGEHIGTVSHGQGHLHVLLDQQHSAAGVAGHRAEHREQALDDHGSQAQAHLVDHEEAGRRGQSPSQRQHLLLPTREQPSPPAEIHPHRIAWANAARTTTWIRASVPDASGRPGIPPKRGGIPYEEW